MYIRRHFASPDPVFPDGGAIGRKRRRLSKTQSNLLDHLEACIAPPFRLTVPRPLTYVSVNKQRDPHIGGRVLNRPLLPARHNLSVVLRLRYVLFAYLSRGAAILNPWRHKKHTKRHTARR